MEQLKHFVPMLGQFHLKSVCEGRALDQTWQHGPAAVDSAKQNE